MAMPIRRLNRKQKLGFAIALSALATALGVWGPVAALRERLESRALDQLLLFRGPQPTAGLPILIVLVEDESAMPYGFRAPTPRALLADVVQRLTALGAGCIGLDFFLDRPQVSAQDDPLEAALARAASPVVLVQPAIPRFARHAVLAYSQVSKDRAGVVRQMRVTNSSHGPPSFVGAVFRQCVGQYPVFPQGVDPEALLLNPYGPPSHLADRAPTFTVIKAKDLQVLPPAMVQGRMVLVGSGFEDLGDTFLTSFSRVQEGSKIAFGVELHATVLGMILQQRYIYPVRGLALAALVLLFYLLAGLDALFLNTMGAVAAGLLQIVGWGALAANAFVHGGWLLPVTTPILCAVLVFLLCLTLHFFTEGRYTRFLRSTFGQSISPNMLAKMVRRGGVLNVGGESRTLSLFCSDLQGFSTISAQLSPGTLVELLNEYLDVMTDMLFEEQGTLDKFEGDAIRAFFGAPLEQPDHAVRSCRTALIMQGNMSALNQGWSQRGLPKLSMRIGIHTGKVVIGHIGAQQQRDFTVIGDAANVASRLEEANTPFGTRIIVSEDTLALTGDLYLTRELGRIVASGGFQPVTIHELLGERSRLAEHVQRQRALYEAYAEALQMFYAGEFAAARARFASNADTFADIASRFMAGQCAALLAAPPAEWDGAVVPTSE